jgi:hypothetical protein
MHEKFFKYPGWKGDKITRVNDFNRIEAGGEVLRKQAAMKAKSICLVLLMASAFLVAGCFETQFDFKTIVHQDGSVYRETHIDGRGANLFKVPSGPGWEAKTWETKGAETFLPDTYYHVLAQGRFASGQEIPPDYEYDVERQIKAWGEEEKKQLELAGIQPPYEESLSSRNRIQVNLVKGWLTHTFFYEEVFQTIGEIEALLFDLKEEIKKKNENRGELLDAEELEGLARIRLEDEFLSQVRFKNELFLPGKVVSSNAQKIEKGKAIWQFSMKNFEDNYSTYTLKAVSRSLSLTGVILMIGVGFLGFLTLVLLGIGVQRYRGRIPKKKKEK